MLRDLRDLAGPAVAGAIEANLFEAWGAIGRAAPAAAAGAGGTAFGDGPDLRWLLTGVPHPWCNAVVHARLPATPSADLDAAIAAVLAPFVARRVPVSWFVGPSTRPPDLGARLGAHGLRLEEDMPGMAVDLLTLQEGPPPPPGVAVDRVADPAGLRDWLQAFARGFELPPAAADFFGGVFAALGLGDGGPWRHYVARLEGRPVAASSLFVGAGVAGVYDVAAVPEARRRGIGSAVTRAPLQAGRALGYRVGVLYASQMGVPVYRRLGFQEYCTFTVYVRDAAAAHAP